MKVDWWVVSYEKLERWTWSQRKERNNQSQAEPTKSQELEPLVSSYLWKQVKEELKKGKLADNLY